MASRASRPICRALPPGCGFHPRCADAMPCCATQEPRGWSNAAESDGAMLALRERAAEVACN